MFPVSCFPRRRAVLLAGLGATVLAPAARSAELPAPKGRVILTIDGKIGRHNQGQQAAFDMAMLQALPQHSFTTNTPWYSRPVKFTGPLLREVLDAVKVEGRTIQASAINDYSIGIPVSDAYQHRVIIARLIDDHEVPVRLKGPLFVVYPFDEKTELRTSVYIERSIWQLRHMSIE